MNIVLIKDKERKYIRVITNLFSITIGWLCEPFIRAWRAYVSRNKFRKRIDNKLKM